MILYKSFHNIDVAKGRYYKKDIPQDFNEFVKGYISFAATNNNKSYSVIDNSRTVVCCISNIIQGITEENQKSLQELDQISDNIALKLLTEETEVQDQIAATGTKIKTGSLIQVLVKTEAGELQYVVAKVEHSEWYDGESLQKNFGFPSEKKNVWKSAVFHIDEELNFNVVQIYTDNQAKYWAEKFLELREERNDETNTRIAFDAMDGVLKRNLYKLARIDYYTLRNTLIQTLRKPHIVNYNNLVGALMDDYELDEPSIDKTKIIRDLRDLPDKKHFDTQFTSVPQAIKKRRYLKFTVTPSIELRITEGIDDYMSYIQAEDDGEGKTYLKIECPAGETYNLFKHR